MMLPILWYGRCSMRELRVIGADLDGDGAGVAASVSK